MLSLVTRGLSVCTSFRVHVYAAEEPSCQNYVFPETFFFVVTCAKLVQY